MRIIPSSGLADEEVERMMEEAQMYREKDRARRELAETRNAADTTIYSAEKFLREMGEQVSDQARRDIAERIEAVRDVVSSDDVALIRRQTAELWQTLQAVGGQYEGPDGAAGGTVIEGEPA
jgi:molecular chaperone DnaK